MTIQTQPINMTLHRIMILTSNIILHTRKKNMKTIWAYGLDKKRYKV